MITILHGEDIVSSRNELIAIKARFDSSYEVASLNEITAQEERVTQILQSNSLFAQKKALIIENLHEVKDKKVFTKLLNLITANETSADIILWFNKLLTKIQLGKFTKKTGIKEFSLPKNLFKFLDNIVPKNSRLMFSQLSDIRKNQSDEFIFLMIVRQIRLLLLAKDNKLEGMPTWMKMKLERQAHNFTINVLKEIYQELFMIDVKIKTGQNTLPIGAQLDLLLLKI